MEKCIAKATVGLQSCFRDDVGVGLAVDRWCTLASSPVLARAMRACLGHLAGEVTSAAVTLGCGLAPGRRRAAKGAAAKLAYRLHTAVKRHAKIARVAARAHKARQGMTNIYTAGVRPAMGCLALSSMG